MNPILTYFEDVLGVRQVLRPAPSVYQVAFWFDAILSAEAATLLEKMIKAMKISREQVTIHNGEELPPPAAYYICTSAKQMEKLADAQKILTYSPELLLQEPQHKKKVWDDLQKVMNSL